MRILLAALLTLSSVAIHASDVEKEKRWEDQIVDSIMDGDALHLNADGHQFLGIYTESNSESDKGMIVVHGTGIHPNWEQIVQPVRVEMIDRGWNTLAIQMPILANEATYEDYVPLYPEVPGRLTAAVAHLKDQGNKEIVIVAHSQGATMSAYYLAQGKHEVAAFVAIGMGATQKDSHLNSALALEKISIPVLDIYGSEDLEGVLSTKDKRSAGAAGNAAYSQQEIEDANHFFDDHNEQLIDAIDAWLKAR